MRIATAFLALGPKTFDSVPELFTMDLIDEQIDVTSRAVLGLSLSAALNAPIGETRFGVFRM